MKKVIVINGPNLNLLGIREKNIYGSQDFLSYFEDLKSSFVDTQLHYFQSNHEGAIIDKLHEIGFSFDGIVLNAGAYTHTSLAIGDAIAAITTPVVEVHISNVHKREEFRHGSYLAKNCVGVICGFGLNSYRLGIQSFL
ncbi:type II 3-dehydroquinate dehydratase [Sphingobacterium suaedae]|uniref:3-dehydroquinate dehydratase n=1 Tax=Sphingobacterium suaedae TaxID=1686402 RepID=A0ABW5KB52_9SPHI